jgi:hypothetical protein
MHAFEGDGCVASVCARLNGLRGSQTEHWAEAFAASIEGMTHRLV